MWEYFEAGGPMMWPLLACSIVAVAVLLERMWFWSRLNLRGEESESMRLLGEFQEKGHFPPGSPHGLLTAMLYAGAQAPENEAAKAMEVLAIESLNRMRRGMNILDTIITAAPMLGIMGTVLGIISSFDMLGAAGVSEPKEVIAGIAQALITTATGLGIAVVTIFPFNYFNFRIENAQDIFDAFGTRMELALADAHLKEK